MYIFIYIYLYACMCVYIYICVCVCVGLLGSVCQWPERLGFNPRLSHTKDSKMVLNTQHYKVRIKGEVEQSRENSSALPYTLV